MEKIKLPKKKTPQIRAYEQAVQRGRQNLHVIYSKDGWGVRNGAAKNVARTFSNKEVAVRHGKQLAQQSKSDLIIHKADGKIQRRCSYRSG